MCHEHSHYPICKLDPISRWFAAKDATAGNVSGITPGSAGKASVPRSGCADRCFQSGVRPALLLHSQQKQTQNQLPAGCAAAPAPQGAEARAVAQEQDATDALAQLTLRLSAPELGALNQAPALQQQASAGGFQHLGAGAGAVTAQLGHSGAARSRLLPSPPRAVLALPASGTPRGGRRKRKCAASAAPFLPSCRRDFRRPL